MAYFPLMVDLDNKKVLIVGGGAVAYRKMKQMLGFGARVRLIAPKICDAILEVDAEEATDRLNLVRRTATEDDLLEADLAILATDDPIYNHQMAELCRAHHILVNVVDTKEDCDFYFPAIYRQGEVVLGVSTGGKSPLLAAHIRDEAAASLQRDYGKIAEQIAIYREKLQEKQLSYAEKKKLLEEHLHVTLGESEKR